MFRRTSDDMRAQAALYLFEHAALVKGVHVDELLTRLIGEQIANLPLGASPSDKHECITSLAGYRKQRK